MYKAALTANLVSDFLSTYQSLPANDLKDSLSEPFVYVDQFGVKLVTNMVGGDKPSDGSIFALSMAEDGWMEMLAMFDQAG